MKKFNNIARLVRSARLKKGLSQTELSHALGYKNGQYISNCERQLCSVPAKAIVRLSGLVNLIPEEIVEAMVADHKGNLEAEVDAQMTRADILAGRALRVAPGHNAITY